MSKHDEARRAFLVRTAVGVGAVGVGAVAGPSLAADANAPAPAGHAGPGHAQMHMHGAGHGAFLNDEDSATVAAFTERLMPGAPGKPGARDAGVLNYIDLALSGAYADQQDFYRRGLAQLDAYCMTTYKRSFTRLDTAQQDEVIAALEEGKAGGFTWPTAPAFFNTLRTHTMEGMFADPLYGGNRNFAGWRLVGFPGAQPEFTPDDLRSSKAFSREATMGLQAQAATVKGRT